MAGTGDYRWRTYHSAGPGRSRRADKRARVGRKRKPRRPITLSRVSFLDDEMADLKASNSGGLDG
jgi:hypothetical protein